MREEILYSLRLWRDGDAAADWRASLKDMRTREVKHFADLHALAAHLDRKTHDERLADEPDAPRRET